MSSEQLAVPNGENLEQLKENMFDNVRFRLGDGIVDLELDPEHYEAAYNFAIKVYRQRAENSVQESYTLLTIDKDQDTFYINMVLKKNFNL